ncbi:MAG: right-handed parallel beta-helix repeat-containing protein, partial [Planctomycetota bacterium]
NDAPNLPPTDVEGSPRVCDGNLDGTAVVDMGTFEFRARVQNITKNHWYQTIQLAIDHANEADEIVATAGTYYENINFKGKNLTLMSTDPNDPFVVEQTIIDGHNAGVVVTFESHEDANCILTGFTVTHGLSDGAVGHGGAGIYCFESSPRISNCVVRANFAHETSGNASAILCQAASPQISDCIIINNTSSLDSSTIALNNGSNAMLEDCTIVNNWAGGFGGGVHCSSSAPTIVTCLISDNYAYYFGGGISCEQSDAIIEDCTIARNSVDIAEGGGIACWGGESQPRITHCRITENRSNGSGGGICGCSGPIEGCLIDRNTGDIGGGLYDCTGAITNCVIARNSTASYGQFGGGLANCDGPISNCTIIENTVASIYGGFGGGLYDCDGIITNCIIWQNEAETEGDQLYSCSEPSYSCIQDWIGGGTGNIADDPCFVYPGYWADANDPNIIVEPNDPNAVWVDGNYRLRWDSPCIDAGDNNSVPADTNDLDGDGNTIEPIPFDLGGLSRFIEDLCTVDSGNPSTVGPPVVDMGAYEFLPADIDGSGAVNLYDLSMLALYWGETGCGRCSGANLNCDIKVDFKDLAILCGNWLAGTEPEL